MIGTAESSLVFSDFSEQLWLMYIHIWRTSIYFIWALIMTLSLHPVFLRCWHKYFHSQSVRNSVVGVSHKWEGEKGPAHSPWHVNLSQPGSVKSLVTSQPHRYRMRWRQTENPSWASSVGFLCLKSYCRPSTITAFQIKMYFYNSLTSTSAVLNKYIRTFL